MNTCMGMFIYDFGFVIFCCCNNKHLCGDAICIQRENKLPNRKLSSQSRMVESETGKQANDLLVVERLLIRQPT